MTLSGPGVMTWLVGPDDCLPSPRHHSSGSNTDEDESEGNPQFGRIGSQTSVVEQSTATVVYTASHPGHSTASAAADAFLEGPDGVTAFGGSPIPAGAPLGATSPVTGPWRPPTDMGFSQDRVQSTAQVGVGSSQAPSAGDMTALLAAMTARFSGVNTNVGKVSTEVVRVNSEVCRVSSRLDAMQLQYQQVSQDVHAPKECSNQASSDIIHLHLGCTKISENSITFFGRYNPLSNFYACNFTVDTQSYSCMEQYLQFKKAEAMACDVQAQKILKTHDPVLQKRLGSACKGNKEAWDTTYKETVMSGLKQKFEQNPELRNYLKSTGEKKLGEASTDDIWGIGLKLTDPNALDSNLWKGKNCLGELLMRVRQELK